MTERGITTHEMAARSKLVAGADWARRPQQTRNGRRLVMSRPPSLLRDAAGNVVGLDLFVRLYDVETGAEIPIDPVRRFINPPTIHEFIVDPVAACWAILWDSVDVAPNPDDWVP